MNILFVTHYTGLGGANIAMLNLIQQYQERGIASFVILPEVSGPLKGKLEELGIPNACVRMPWWICGKEETKRNSVFRKVKTYLSNYRAAFAIRSYVYQWNIDIIHTNSTVTAAGMLAARMTGRPHVWHLREDLSNYGWDFALNEKQVKKWFHNSDRVIVISRACGKVYEKYLDLEKTVLIYDGAQVDEKRELPFRLEEEVFHILYLGGMSESKGWRDVLKAVSMLKTAAVGSFKLWMPGCRENGTEDKELAKFIAAENLEGYVEPLEYLSRERLDQLRYGMNLFIMASSQEMFGLVTVEAMLSGVPVIASDTGANPEIIRDGENGYLYPCGDVEALAGVIRRVMASDQRVITEKARAEAEEKFSMKNCAEETLHVYRELLEGKEA